MYRTGRFREYGDRSYDGKRGPLPTRNDVRHFSVCLSSAIEQRDDCNAALGGRSHIIDSSVVGSEKIPDRVDVVSEVVVSNTGFTSAKIDPGRWEGRFRW